MANVNQAVILAAGEGTRLRPYTEITPKAMLPINGKPILRWILEHLKKYNITSIILCTNRKLEPIFYDYLDDGKRFNVKIQYSISKQPLGTLGEVLNCKNKLDKQFILYYGDQITNIDLHSMIKLHNEKKAMATLALSSNVYSDYGIVDLASSNSIVKFHEKPLIEKPVWTGIAVIEKSLLDITKGRDFAKDLFPKALKKNKLLMGYTTTAFWSDVGSISHYERTNQMVRNTKLF